ncbi:MAG: small basic protein [Candidatus Omnitrophica bacterium]|nr:small basic protein [Candidatus Omnitrophota bacterium]
MSVHPSLSSREEGKGKRSVLKRFERLKELIEKEKRKAGDSIFGLPKLKVLRWKVKKAKKVVEAEAAAAEGTTKATGEGTTPAAKEEKTEKKK